MKTLQNINDKNKKLKVPFWKEYIDVTGGAIASDAGLLSAPSYLFGIPITFNCPPLLTAKALLGSVLEN